MVQYGATNRDRAADRLRRQRDTLKLEVDIWRNLALFLSGRLDAIEGHTEYSMSRVEEAVNWKENKGGANVKKE